MQKMGFDYVSQFFVPLKGHWNILSRYEFDGNQIHAMISRAHKVLQEEQGSILTHCAHHGMIFRNT